MSDRRSLKSSPPGGSSPPGPANPPGGSRAPSQDRGRGPVARVGRAVAAAGTAAAAYMVFESQWVECREAQLAVPGLPKPWSGLTVLHLSDVHAGVFTTNQLSLGKVVRWAAPLAPDLVFLTGDILGDPNKSRGCLDLLTGLHPPLGMFAVTGNHEYGLSKGPFARPRDTRALWAEAGITLLVDDCVTLTAREGAALAICGADHLTGGHGLQLGGSPSDAFAILLVHKPPSSDSPLASAFPLAFAGHTHGGQIRVPSPAGLTPLNREHHEYREGANPWGRGQMVVSRGVGASFLPFRLLTRPEATLWRLVYTSRSHS